MRLAYGDQHPGHAADIFLELGWHQLDWLLATFGDVDHVIAKQVKTTRASGQSVEYAVMTVRMADNSIAHVELSWAETQRTYSFEFTGDAGMLEFDSCASQPITIHTDKPVLSKRSSDATLTVSILERQLAHIVNGLTGVEAPLVTPDALLKVMRVAMAARQSVETGKPVYIERGGSV
nr:Gfo/Idh/MocA family oxidoreductase [Lentibacillus saliphilus]